MDDLISRQAAIDRINKQREHLKPDLFEQDDIGDMAYRVCAEFIGRLPSAERHGRWEYNDEAYVGSNPYGSYNCSVCGENVPHKTDYCPNCGAKMDGEEE